MKYKIITAVPKTAEEITGIVGCKAFSWYFEGDDDWIYYSRGMNDIALKKERIEFNLYPNSIGYDCTGAGFQWRLEWLDDIKRKIDWSKVPAL